jgi:UDP-GlcNAc:undecaprenyl-phosphate/decaprenyl-phosphate GlcNAc-1-phosphate transferase
MTYALIFLSSLILSLILTRYVRTSAHAHGWLEPPQLDRHVHTTPIPRIGGVAIYVSFTAVIVVALLVQRALGPSFLPPIKSYLVLLGSALIIFLLGLVDDLYGVGPYGKFLVQAVAATILFLGGFGIHRLDLISSGKTLTSFIGLPLTILWVLLITNAFNLIDGLDGLAAGSALFPTTVVFILSLVVPNPLVTCLAVALAGAILGFLRFNFHPASIFLGDSGSLFIGFMLSAVALAGSQKAPTMVAVAIPVVALGLPILDVFLAVVRRFLGGKPLFGGDRQHIHHKLLKRGLHQRETVLILYAVSAGFGFLSLILLHQGTAIALVLAVAGIGVLVGVQQLRYQEFAELLSLLERGTHRRQILTNHIAVRHATESLNECNEFGPICALLQQALQPIGFKGVRLQMLNPNGFLASSFHPLHSETNGYFVFLWSGAPVSESAWELRLELVTTSRVRWGFATLFRAEDAEALSVDINILTQDFRTSLSDALDRACSKLEAAQLDKPADKGSRSHKLAAGSMAD